MQFIIVFRLELNKSFHLNFVLVWTCNEYFLSYAMRSSVALKIDKTSLETLLDSLPVLLQYHTITDSVLNLAVKFDDCQKSAWLVLFTSLTIGSTNSIKFRSSAFKKWRLWSSITNSNNGKITSRICLRHYHCEMNHRQCSTQAIRPKRSVQSASILILKLP